MCACVCVSVCLLPLDLYNCKVVLHFEQINRKLLMRMPGKKSQLLSFKFKYLMGDCVTNVLYNYVQTCTTHMRVYMYINVPVGLRWWSGGTTPTLGLGAGCLELTLTHNR